MVQLTSRAVALAVALGAALVPHTAVGSIAAPSAPLNVQLSTVSQDSLRVSWSPPAQDGGAPISAYVVDWDPSPGTRETQVVTTAVNTGANEVQTVQSFAQDVDEVQEVATSATAIPEVQTITTTAAPGETLGGVFTLSLDTTAQGGSVQRSGVIAYNAPATTGRASVLSILNAMSNVGPSGVQTVTRSGPDAQGGYTWSVTFAAAMGDVPALALQASALTGSGATVVLATPTPGNVIAGGTFTLGFRGATTADIPCDATDAQMQSALQALDSIDAVQVSRSGPDFQRGFVWRVTFSSPSALSTGNVPMLTVGSNVQLRGVGARVDVREATRGNQLGATFQLQYKGTATADLPFDCDAATMKRELERLNPTVDIGTVDVSRSPLPDPQGGYTWTVSFLSAKGALPALVSDVSRLTESRTDGVVSKGVRVTRTRPGTVQEVQEIRVTTTAASVSATTFFSLQAPFAGQTTTTGRIPADPVGDGTCLATRPEVQRITVSTVDTTAAGGDNLVSARTAIRLVYTSNTEAGRVETTPVISVNSAMGDCVAGATAIRTALEALEGTIGSIAVGASAPLATQACTWDVTFTSQPGNVPPLRVVAAGDAAAAPANTVTIGDDTIAVTTVQDGVIDIIKTELERLANVNQVTVSATPAVTPNADKTCVWRITFDGNAGNLPLLQVSVDDGTTVTPYGTSRSTGNGADTITVAAGQDGTSVGLGGVFALELAGQRTGYMPFDVSAAVLRSQLQALSTVGSIAVTRSLVDPNNGYAWTISFLSNLGDVPAIVPDAKALTGTAPYINVQEAVKGVLPPFNSKDPANGLSFGSRVVTDLSDLSVTAPHLDENVPFFFRVTAINAAGRGVAALSSPTSAIPVPQPPTAPVNATIAPIDGTSVLVSMRSPLSDGGQPIDAYQVEYGLEPIVDEVQQVVLSVPVRNEIQTITTSTDTVAAVQIVHLTSTYSGTPTNEVQHVMCDAPGTGSGFFTLSFLGETTARIAATETSVAAIKTALEELNSITTVSVAFFGGRTTACAPCDATAGCSSGLAITFQSVVGLAGDVPLLTADTNGLDGNRRVDIVEQTKGQAPVAGTFRLSYLRGRDADTVPLQFDTTDATMQAALRALDAAVTVVVTSDQAALPAGDVAAGARLWRVTFQNAGYVPPLVLRPANNLLVGNGAGIQVYTAGATYGTGAASVAGNAVRGSFSLRLGGYATAPISFDASDTTVKRSLEALPNVGTVTVTRTGPSLKDEYVWSVTFVANPGQFPVGAGDVDALQVADASQLAGTNSAVAVATVQDGSRSVDGTFQLAFTDGVAAPLATRPLSPHESADGVKQALQALATVGRVSVSRDELPDGYAWRVTFDACRARPPVCNTGDLAPLVADASQLVGGLVAQAPTVSVSEVLKGVAPLQTLVVTDLSGGEPFETTLAGLTYGTRYFARLSFRNAQGLGRRAWTTPPFVLTQNVPAGPLRPVRLVASSPTSISVAWEPPTVNGGAVVSGYELWISEWGDVYRKVYDRPNDALTLSTTLLTTADQVVESGKKYRFKARAVTFCRPDAPTTACLGAFSEPVEYSVRAPVVPQPPAVLVRDSTTTINTAAASDGVVVVRWTEPLDNGGAPLTAYELFMDDGVSGWVKQTLAGAFPHGLTFTSAPGLVEGRVYRFYIRALNAVGPSGSSSVLSVVLANVPAAPAAPTLVDVTATTMTLQWQPPLGCTSTITGCNGAPLLGYKLWQFAGVPAGYTASGSPVNAEIQRIQTFVDPPAPEIQRVTVTGATGKFALYVNGKTTALLDVATATDAAVKAAVEATGVGTVSVTGAATATSKAWTVTFTGWTTGALPGGAMAVVPSALSNAVLATPYSTAVERLQVGSSALGGDFTVSFRGEETPSLPAATTTAAQLKRHLENLGTVGVVDVSATAGAANTMTWDVTFTTELGDLPLLRVTGGRLTAGGPGSAGRPRISVTTVQDGTPGVLVYDGSSAPDVLSTTVTDLVPDTLYAFKVVALNAAGDGLAGASTPAIAASSGAAASQTTASGKALTRGMAGFVYEVQTVTTTGLANGASFTLRWQAGPAIGPISLSTTAAALAAMIPAADPALGPVQVSRQALSGSDVAWYVTFVSQTGDVPLLVASSPATVSVAEFLKGRANEFTIAPRKASGAVVTYATLPAAFQGRDRFWTELWATPPSVVDGTHAFVDASGGLAQYNAPVYDVQSLTFDGTTGTFRLKLDTSTSRVGGVVALSPVAVDAAVLSAAATTDAAACDLVKQSVEALSNVASVSVSRTTTPAVAGVSPMSWTYRVTFTGDLCAQPLLELVGDAAFMASSTLLAGAPVRFASVQPGECEVQTVTTAASVESLPQILSVATWLDDSAAPTTIGGSFDLTLAGGGTITVPVGSTAAQLEALLEALPSIDDVSVSMESADYGAATGLRTWLITFNEILGSVPDVTLSSKAALTGNAADVRIKEVRRLGLSLGGTFVLNFMGDTTENLPFDVEPAALKRELENLRSIVEVDVQKEELFNGNRWTISFTKNLGNLPLLDALPLAYEIQSVETVGGSPTPLDGVFRLAFRGDVTAPIAFDASDAAMKAALEALPALGGRVDVTRTDRLDAGNRFRWLVTFRSLRGDVGNLAVADAAQLTGSGAGVAVAEVQAGNAQSLTGQHPTLSVFEKRAGRPSYTGRYVPRAPGTYSVAVQQLVPGGLEALYFDNYWLQDAPVLHRVDAVLSFDWGTGAITALGRDYVSIRWFGKLAAPFDDDYVFYVQSTEGVRVWFDHELVVDTWDAGESGSEGQSGGQSGGGGAGTAATFRATLQASAFYDVRIEYHEETGAASFSWRWSSSRLALAPVPSSALFHGDHVVGSPFAIDVTPGATDFPYTTAFGDGLSAATAGVPAAFVIQARDQNGNNKTLGGDEFRVTINSATALLAPFAEPEYLGNGQYRVQYLPGVSGTYQLSIQTLDGSEIQCGRGQSAACSPFAVTISPGATTPQTSQALGVATSTYGVLDPLVEAVAGEAATFLIQARDTYGNARWTAGDDPFETTLVLTTDRSVAYRSSVLRVAGAATFGRYEVQYSVPRAGTYELQSTLRKAPILMCPTGVVAACLPLGSPSVLKVVHSALHAPSSTVDDTATSALSTAVSSRATTFTVYARDAFGNLRIGDRTAHSVSTGDGRSDAFLATLAGPETVTTSSAVQVLESADQQFAGVFALSFGVFRRPLCAQCVVALAGSTLSIAGTSLVALLLPGTKFAVRHCVFTAQSVTSTSVVVAGSHGCADFTARQDALQVADAATASRLTTTLLPQDVSAAALKYALQELHPNANAVVHVTRTSLPPAAGNAGNVGRLQWSITFVAPLAAWSDAQLAVEYPADTAATTLFATPLAVSYTASGGVYPITYTPTLSGVYLLAVTTPSGQHVQGSPFTVTVRDDVTHGGSSLAAEGNALVEGFDEPLIELEAGAALTFGVQLKDQRRLEQQVLRVRAVTLDVVNEVQKVLATTLPLTLSFRGAATGATLQAGDAFAAVKAKLEALSTVTDGGLQVSAAPENAAATSVAAGTAFLVTFTAERGALPFLQVTAGAATVTRVTQGVTPRRAEVQTLTP
ncbi:hypothetical protein ATCC90586_000434 [Pythium insidiosum]|nr:hypothetical protein ATCC90586_000434 [Pythium insidiosum]